LDKNVLSNRFGERKTGLEFFLEPACPESLPVLFSILLEGQRRIGAQRNEVRRGAVHAKRISINTWKDGGDPSPEAGDGKVFAGEGRKAA
jgi:hypothetical protein